MDWRIEEALRQHDYAMSMFIQSLCEIEGMKAENQKRISNGESIAYSKEDFLEVAINNGMNHNNSIERHMR